MGAWIEIDGIHPNEWGLESHPTMGAWIEILKLYKVIDPNNVAPHDGCVD